MKWGCIRNEIRHADSDVPDGFRPSVMLPEECQARGRNLTGQICIAPERVLPGKVEEAVRGNSFLSTFHHALSGRTVS